MAMSLLDEIGLEHALKFMRESTNKAIANAHAHGLPVTVYLNGALYKILPNGHVEPVKPAEATATKGALAA